MGRENVARCASTGELAHRAEHRYGAQETVSRRFLRPVPGLALFPAGPMACAMVYILSLLRSLRIRAWVSGERRRSHSLDGEPQVQLAHSLRSAEVRHFGQPRGGPFDELQQVAIQSVHGGRLSL